MKAAVLFLLFSLTISISPWINGCRSASASTSKHELDLLGVAPQDEEYYRGGLSSSSGTLKCKDGSKHFTKSQFNDDFCDCPDGSDEPGTSACPNGKFYCKNAGHASLTLYSSRVNDGICDCCDGSDEYDGRIKCPNTCWEAGKVAREKLKKKIATYLEGVTLREQEVEQAKEAIAKEEAELSKLKNEEKILKGLVEQLKERKEQIERAEEKERLQKEKEEEERKKAEEAKLKETKTEGEADVLQEETMKNDIKDKINLDPHPSQDVVDDHGKPLVEVEHTDETLAKGPLTNEAEQVKGEDGKNAQDDSQKHASKEEEETTEGGEGGLDTGKEGNAETENTDSLSREELGRRIASRWTGEKIEEETKEADSTTTTDHENHESSTEDHDEEYNSYDSEDEGSRYDNDDNEDHDTEEHTEDFAEEDHADSSSYKYESDEESDLSDITSSDNPSWLEKIRKTVRRILEAVNFFQGPVDKSEADHVRKEYDESSKKLTKIQSRISSLTKKLKQDFGPDKQFYSFYGQCFESQQNKYVYKICPFKDASQTEGYSSTSLGNWEKFEDSYKTMQFSGGDKCWNGPDRSLKVKLRCGLKPEISDVDEPSRCEYVAFLSAPALCHKEKLKELQDKLDKINMELPLGHDEL